MTNDLWYSPTRHDTPIWEVYSTQVLGMPAMVSWVFTGMFQRNRNNMFSFLFISPFPRFSIPRSVVVGWFYYGDLVDAHYSSLSYLLFGDFNIWFSCALFHICAYCASCFTSIALAFTISTTRNEKWPSVFSFGILGVHLVIHQTLSLTRRDATLGEKLALKDVDRTSVGACNRKDMLIYTSFLVRSCFGVDLRGSW